MRKILVRCFLAGALFLCLQNENAQAFEFSVSGSSTWSYALYTGGQKGLFGTTLPGASGLAGVGSWFGSDLVSGARSSNSSMSTSFFPVIKVNQATTLQGVYRIGGFSTGMTGSSPGSGVATAAGAWSLWYGSIELPIGVFGFGKKDFGFGCGFQYDAGNRSTEYLTMVTDYGPIVIGFGWYPWRNADELIATRQMPDSGSVTYFWNQRDANAKTSFDLMSFVAYEAGPIDMGVGGLYTSFDLAPTVLDVDQYQQLPRIKVDSNEGFIYFKYFGGRFFFNTEADWYYRTVNRSRTPTLQMSTPDRYSQAFNSAYAVVDDSVQGGSGSIFRNRYVESWRGMVEFGVVSGPAKTTFNLSRTPGIDRRHGVLIDTQPCDVDMWRPTRDFLIWNPDLGNSTVYSPYSMLLSTLYGSGNGAYGRGGTGYMADATVYAARVDYALAANLNFFVSGLYASRVSKSYPFGYIRPLQDGAKSASVDYGYDVRVDPTINSPDGFNAGRALIYNNPKPSIPETSLGWEVNVGVAWQILSSQRVDIRGAYWQPGLWFNYACIDKNNVGFLNNEAPSPANSYWTNPGRAIEPIWGVELSTSCNF